MKLDRTAAGLEAQLRVSGFGRFFAAGFLGFWLAGWAAGEAFVVWILSAGAWSLLTGEPPDAGRERLRPELALPAGLFLLLWLSLWTLGGIAAARELLRLLFGRDRMLVRYDGVEIERSYGLLRSRRALRRDEIRRFYQSPTKTVLNIETTRGTIELTRLGTAEERTELAEALSAELKLPPEPETEGALPEGWCEILSPERDYVLVKDPAMRRKQAKATWIVCAVVSSIALYVISTVLQQPEMWGIALVLAAGALLIAWGGVWLSFGRNEWRLDKGRIVLQRRFGQNRTTRFEAVSLELDEDRSGEDGTSYLLSGVAANVPAEPRSYKTGKHLRVIHRQTEDAAEPRKLGQWLSERCQLSLVDRTTAEAKGKELEQLKGQLANSGRLGRAALRIVERYVPRQRPPDGRA
jgi:hypothetical protein